MTEAEIIDGILEREGGFTDDASDSLHTCTLSHSLQRNKRIGAFVLDSPMSRGIVHAELTRSLLQRQPPIVVEDDDDITAYVVRLLMWRSPSAVLRSIRAVVVDTVNRVAGWSWTHIRQERGVVVQPSIAHHNAACAVGSVLWVSQAMATAFGVQPRFVFDWCRAVLSGAVSGAPGGGRLGAETAAASCEPLYQSGRFHGRHSAALTLASPIHSRPSSAVAPPYWRICRQATEYLAGQVQSSHVLIIPYFDALSEQI